MASQKRDSSTIPLLMSTSSPQTKLDHLPTTKLIKQRHDSSELVDHALKRVNQPRWRWSPKQWLGYVRWYGTDNGVLFPIFTRKQRGSGRIMTKGQLQRLFRTKDLLYFDGTLTKKFDITWDANIERGSNAHMNLKQDGGSLEMSTTPTVRPGEATHADGFVGDLLQGMSKAYVAYWVFRREVWRRRLREQGLPPTR